MEDMAGSEDQGKKKSSVVEWERNGRKETGCLQGRREC